jgi:hypothetical protein
MVFGRSEHPDKAFNKVVNIAERARLLSGPIDCHRHSSHCLKDEIGDDPTVVATHMRPIGVKDTD